MKKKQPEQPQSTIDVERVDAFVVGQVRQLIRQHGAKPLAQLVANGGGAPFVPDITKQLGAETFLKLIDKYEADR